MCQPPPSRGVVIAGQRIKSPEDFRIRACQRELKVGVVRKARDGRSLSQIQGLEV